MEALNSEFSKAHHTKTMKQRTLWAMLTSLSRNCTVKKSDGTKISGLIHTLCKKGVILYKKSEDTIIRNKLHFDEIISIECPNIQIANKNKFKIDQEISKQSKLQKRQLQQWEGEESSALSFDIKEYKSWDQFEINAQKFGVVSTYDEKLYTTAIPHISELTEEQVLRAKIVEKELNSNSLDKEDNEDEEAMFGAVLGSGRYEVIKGSNSKKIPKKNDEKEKYKKIRKGLETSKKNDDGKELIGESVESLNLILPKVEVNENVQNNFRLFKQTVQSPPKVSANSLKEFSKEISPKIVSLSRVNII